MTKIFRLAIVALLAPHVAHAWVDMGHSIVGAIAEEKLTPKARIFVRSIVGLEPLSVSAVWPDHVREDARFHDFADFHFVEIPTGDTYDTNPNREVKDAYGAIVNSISLLKQDSTSQVEKAIALRYLAHLIGDIHQPLHVGNGHDLGGNVCFVVWRNENAPSNLHSIWDDNLVDALGDTYLTPKPKVPRYYPNYSYYLAGMKKSRPDLYFSQTPIATGFEDIKGWLEESAHLRESTVYPDPNGSMHGVDPKDYYKHRAYCMWYQNQQKKILGPTSPQSASDIPLTQIPILDDAYVRPNLKIVEAQLITAGLRLAAILNEVAEHVGPPSDGIDDLKQQQILEAVQNQFMNRVYFTNRTHPL